MTDRRRNSITWMAPPVPTPVTRGRLGPCDHCRVGDHHLCTKVGCYRCPAVNHPRHHAAGNGEQVQHPTPFLAGRFKVTTLAPEADR